MTKAMQARLDVSKPFAPKVVWYQHHNAENVAVQSDLQGLHRRFCLCWMCKTGPSGTRKCEIAARLYAMCKEFNLVTPVWECPKFEDERE